MGLSEGLSRPGWLWAHLWEIIVNMVADTRRPRLTPQKLVALFLGFES